MMTQRHSLLASALVSLAAVGLTWAPAEADHVKIEVTPEHAQTGTTVVVPAPAPPLPAVSIPQTLQADEIKAHQVRAQTIYANKIEADEIQGTVHQTNGVKVGKTRGDIKAPQVTASVIYADEIKANSITAENIYVRDLARR